MTMTCHNAYKGRSSVLANAAPPLSGPAPGTAESRAPTPTLAWPMARDTPPSNSSVPSWPVPVQGAAPATERDSPKPFMGLASSAQAPS